MIKILYLSNLCSPKVLSYIFESSQNSPALSAQKFHSLLANGLAIHNDRCGVETQSIIPVVQASHKRKIWRLRSEVLNKITFHYTPILNIKYLKNIGVFFYTFSKVLWWGLFRNGSRRVILSDVLNFTSSSAALLASKLTPIKNIAIVTDVPGVMASDSNSKKSFIGLFSFKVINFIINSFDGYILLTQQMNEKVNQKCRPYLIMEGLVDINMKMTPNELGLKSQERILIYAGGLHEKYGIKSLILAFMKLTSPDVRLHLYGKGKMVKDLKEYTNQDPRIQYLGIVPNEQVVADQLKAILLVNPRPTVEEFTKYSFPSKNMEYMVSGTPMITTNLPGMPKEYHQYVFLFEDESVEGMYLVLEKTLQKSKNDLHLFGQLSKKFVLKNKNNRLQAERILDFIDTRLF